MALPAPGERQSLLFNDLFTFGAEDFSAAFLRETRDDRAAGSNPSPYGIDHSAAAMLDLRPGAWVPLLQQPEP